MIFAFDIFDLFVSRVSLEWPGNPNPSYSRPSKLPCICASLCTLWNATLYTDGILYPSQHHSLGRELEMPHSPVPNNRHVYLKFQLNVCFSFFAVWSLAHTHSFSFTKSSKIYIKTIWKSSLCNSVAQKTHTLCLMQQIKPSFFFFFWASMHFDFSSALAPVHIYPCNPWDSACYVTIVLCGLGPRPHHT